MALIVECDQNSLVSTDWKLDFITYPEIQIYQPPIVYEGK